MRDGEPGDEELVASGVMTCLRSRIHIDLAEMCIDACEECADECEQHDHEHCQVCAEKVRACAGSCREMVAAA